VVSQILHTGETRSALQFVVRMHIVGALCAHAVVTLYAVHMLRPRAPREAGLRVDIFLVGFGNLPM